MTKIINWGNEPSDDECWSEYEEWCEESTESDDSETNELNFDYRRCYSEPITKSAVFLETSSNSQEEEENNVVDLPQKYIIDLDREIQEFNRTVDRVERDIESFEMKLNALEREMGIIEDSDDDSIDELRAFRIPDQILNDYKYIVPEILKSSTGQRIAKPSVTITFDDVIRELKVKTIPMDFNCAIHWVEKINPEIRSFKKSKLKPINPTRYFNFIWNLLGY